MRMPPVCKPGVLFIGAAQARGQTAARPGGIGASDMIAVGLTGGIASGKSEVAAMLAAKGAAVIYADQIGHEAYRRGTDEYLQIVAAFGADVIGEDGEIDRRRLGEKVFNDPEARQRLQAIVWPAMRRMMEERLAALEREVVPVAVLEAAVLVEADWLPLVDEVWVVEASPEVARQRLMAYKGLSAAEAEARLGAQLTNEERRRHADVVIDNGGSLEDTRRQVDRLWTGLKERAAPAASSRSEGSSG
jgi:dephospho-CoA kinase